MDFGTSKIERTAIPPTIHLCSRYFLVLLAITTSATPPNFKQKPTRNSFHSIIRPFPNLPLFQAALASVSRFLHPSNLLPLLTSFFSIIPSKSQSTTKLLNRTQSYNYSTIMCLNPDARNQRPSFLRNYMGKMNFFHQSTGS